jgi:hypothetical protein
MLCSNRLSYVAISFRCEIMRAPRAHVNPSQDILRWQQIDLSGFVASELSAFWVCWTHPRIGGDEAMGGSESVPHYRVRQGSPSQPQRRLQDDARRLRSAQRPGEALGSSRQGPTSESRQWGFWALPDQRRLVRLNRTVQFDTAGNSFMASLRSAQLTSTY